MTHRTDNHQKTVVTVEGNPPPRSVLCALRRYGLAVAVLLATILSLTSLLRGNSTGNTFYVSPTGSDSNAGTHASPCVNPDYVSNNKASVGDSVRFAGGAYVLR
jgi:hypothetical protein